MNISAVLLWWMALITTIYCEEEAEEDKQERIAAELKLTDWGLADYHESVARIRKKVLLHRAKYIDEIDRIQTYSNYLQEQLINLQNISERDIPYQFYRNYTLLLKPGDLLLNNTDLYKLLLFEKENDNISRNLRIAHPTNNNQTIGKQTFLDLLASSRNISLLQNLWVTWQSNVSYYSNKFREVLSLVTKAAARNGLYDSKQYWEMLVEYEDGYQQAESLWNDIEPTYRKLHKFVLARINNYYKTNFTDIPTYLTGSNFGEDWSNLAGLIIPNQQMYRDADGAFEEQSILDIYKLAKASGQRIGFQSWHRNFLSKNNFNYDICKPTLLAYSASKYSEILTCKNVTWDSYLNAHEAVFEVGLKALDYQSLPRRELRQSFLDEAIVSLGSIIAIQNLPTYGFTPECDYADLENATEHGLAARLLLALRILPKLAYYKAADVWRLEELQNASEDIIISWWNVRKKYQGVQGTNSKEADFFGDPRITSNRPYLGKFLGVILQFELLSYHQLMPFTHNDNLAEQLKDEADFRSVIHDIPIKSPLDVLFHNYAITNINSVALTEFFQPLDEYLNDAPMIPYSTISRIRKIELPPKVTTSEAPVTITEVEFPTILNDQHTLSVNKSDSKKNAPLSPTPASPNTSHPPGIYVVIALATCSFILIGIWAYKKFIHNKRPTTHNRRFQT